MSTSRFSRIRLMLVLLAAVVVGAALAPGTALAQADDPRFTAPSSQEGVTVGEPFTVEGSGCPADTQVSVTTRFGLEETARSDASGEFSVSMTVPEGVFNFSIPEETAEFVLHGTCAGQELANGPLLAVAPADSRGEDQQVSPQPDGGIDAGAGGTAPSRSSPVEPVGLALLVLAAVTLVRSSTRRWAR